MKRSMFLVLCLLLPLCCFAYEQDGLYCHHEEQTCWDAINAFRTKNGLPALEWDESLANDSRDWSQTMGRSGFRHGSNNENIAKNNLRGVASALRVVEQWKNSPGHRRFLLSKNITVAGVGMSEGSSGTHWTFRGKSDHSMTYQTGQAQTPNVSSKSVTHQQTNKRRVGPVRQALRKTFR